MCNNYHQQQLLKQTNIDEHDLHAPAVANFVTVKLKLIQNRHIYNRRALVAKEKNERGNDP